jgi:hypothetical protein
MMKTINYFKKFMLLCTLLLSLSGIAQVQGTSFTYTLANATNPTPTTFEVDVMLVVNHTGTALADGGVKIAQLAFGINFDPVILNGGTPSTTSGAGTFALISGTRDELLNTLDFSSLNGQGQYRGVFTVSGNTFGQLRSIGTLISGSSSILVPNGTYRIGRYRFTNTVAWTASSNANLWINPNNTGGSTTALVNGYKNGTTTGGYAYTTIAPSGAPGVALGYSFAAPLPLILNAPSNICATSAVASNLVNVSPCSGASNGSATITLSPVPTSTTAMYSVDGGAPQAATLVAGAFTVTGLSEGSHEVAVTPTDCTEVTTSSFTISGTPLSTPTVALSSSDADNTFSYGTSVTYTATANNLGGGTATYAFSVGGSVVQTGASNTFTSSTISNGQQVSVAISIADGACLTATTASSNVISNTVTGAVFVNFIYTNSNCGVTSDTVTPSFYCSTPNVGSSSLAYRFKIQNMTTLAVATVDRNVPNANLGMTNIAAYNTTYTVNVAAIVDGIEQPYSGDCTVTTPGLPLNKVVADQCGGTLAALNSTINVSTITGAQNYRFRVALSTAPGTTEVFTSPFPSFRLTSLSTLPLDYGKTYIVEVQSDIINNGVSGTSAYGQVCNVSTPSVVSISTSPNNCGGTLAAINSKIYVNAVPGANQYTYRVALASNPGVYNDIVTPFTNFRLTSLTTVPLLHNTVYNVQVSARVNVGGTNFESGFGSVCTYTTPMSPTSEVQLSQCGDEFGAYQVPTNSTSIVATFVSGASYRFKLEQGAYSQTISRPVNNFTLSMFTGLAPETDYVVSVAVDYYGAGEFGKDCTIKTPAAVIARTMATPFSAVGYPNPFADNFKLEVKSSSSSLVSIKVYDMLGRLVEDRSSKMTEMGSTTIGDSYPSGVYNVIVTQDEEVSTIRMIKR